MLIAHKAELGIKHISRITIVTNDSKAKPKLGEKPVRDLHVFFNIEDLPVEKVTPDEEQKSEPDSRMLQVKKKGGNVMRVHTMSP